MAASLIQDPPEIFVGIWIMGIAFPWVIGRAAARQRQLAAQLDATRRELAAAGRCWPSGGGSRATSTTSSGHGLAAVMLQITSARHVLRRDPAAAEEALRSAEEVGRRSMQELRRTVALLRSDDEAAVAPPLPSARDIPALVDHARAGGLAVELRTRGDLARIAPSVGVALYRIAQEALANAAQHAPHARTVLGDRGGRRAGVASSPRRPGRRSPRPADGAASDPGTAWSGCGSGRPRSAASSPPGRHRRAGA